MSTSDATPHPNPAPRPMRQAASVILLRDGDAGMELLLLRRAERTDDRSSGAWVFPGGTVDASDHDLQRLCTGMDDAAASRMLGLAQGGLALLVAALRECFEEAGLLLAYGADGDLLTEDARIRRLREGGLGIDAVCAGLDARLAVDRLTYAAHWTTPLGIAKRFDTRFFLALAPSGQEVLPGGQEMTEHRWITPRAALDLPKDVLLVNATRHILQSLAGFSTAQACVDHFRRMERIAQTLPRRATGATGIRPVMPWEPMYDEIGHLDPEGRGDASCELQPGVPVRLGARLWRVPAAEGHAYLLQSPSGDCAVIDGRPSAVAQWAALKAVAPGPICWTLATDAAQGGDEDTLALAARIGASHVSTASAPQQLRLRNGLTLRVLDAGGTLRCLLWEEEGLVFTGSATYGLLGDPPGLQDAVARCMAPVRTPWRWIAPMHGFLVDAGGPRAGVANVPA